MTRLACWATTAFGFVGTLAFAAVTALPARADDGVAPGVARISLIQGSVAIRRGDSQDALAAALNAPLLEGDYVTTGRNARGEVQLDGTTSIRLAGDVQMRFTNLEPGHVEAQLAEGSIVVRLLRGAEECPLVDTPSVTIRPDELGSYRITVTRDGVTEVTARSGRADVIAPQGTQVVAAGSTLYAQGPAANPSIRSDAALALDDFDRFNLDRDRDAERALADMHVGDTLAYDNFDRYGRWVDDPTYGYVWAPTVASGWAPYSDGRWLWEDAYGWTWLSAEPWGWAPYHYGRWFHSGLYGWCWYPPAYGVVPVWQPALVGFVLFDDFGFENIGWVPLAPFETFYPWWAWGGWGFGGPNVINVVNINITNVYINSRRAFPSLPTKRFLLGQFNARRFVTAADARGARQVRGQLPFAPTRDNLRFTDAPPAAELAHRAPIERTFAGAPMLATRLPFETTRGLVTTAVESAGRVTSEHPVVEHPVVEHPVVPHPVAPHPVVERPAAPHAPDSWQRFTTSRGGTHAVQVTLPSDERRTFTYRTYDGHATSQPSYSSLTEPHSAPPPTTYHSTSTTPTSGTSRSGGSGSGASHSSGASSVSSHH